MVAFAMLGMTLVAAGSGNTRYAMLAGIIFAATALFGITVQLTTVHRDHLDHHNTPNLLQDTWETSPAFALRRGVPSSIEPHQAGWPEWQAQHGPR
ncbi:MULTISPECIES: hypothetical protein [unclassified Nocardia]|uniref:hypothetical protein n=1 Tax=unclassified Nocardia TaxID=2637762 RepID=UPI002E13DC65|nr:hypothetical protein OG326_25835 [Nocardia sp. NBC_01327]